MRARWVGLVVVLALAGCGGVPSSGPVEAGSIIDEEEARIDVVFSPGGPQVGASQSEILLGFIAAATSPSNGYDVAKQFLADEFRDEWHPNAITQVRTGIAQVRAVSETTFTYSMTTVAHVDDRGQYTDDAPATQTLDFTFVKNDDGEWRIATAPPGIVLTRESFNLIFEAHPLYFFDPTNSYLIADLRWFAKTGSLPTAVVRQLLAGQADWLQQGVTNSYVPAGTTLVSSVSIDAGVATVALSEEVLTLSPDQMQLLRQQLRESIGTVSSVVITVNGVPQEEQDGGPEPATKNLTVESQALALQDDRFGYLKTGGDVGALSGLSAAVVDLGATGATLLRDKSAAAVLTPSGVWLAFADGSKSVRVDSLGYVWSVPAADASAIVVHDASGESYPISAPQFAGMQAVSFAVSRDGARVLMLASTAQGPRVFVAGIVRTEGVPTQIGTPIELSIEQSSTAVDATWIDDNSVAVLRQLDDDDQTSVIAYQLGGVSRALGRLEAGVSIVGGNGLDGLRVLSASGDVFQPRGNGWADTGAAVTWLGTQQ
jgi:hypothetical protein